MKTHARGVQLLRQATGTCMLARSAVGIIALPSTCVLFFSGRNQG